MYLKNIFIFILTDLFNSSPSTVNAEHNCLIDNL